MDAKNLCGGTVIVFDEAIIPSAVIGHFLTNSGAIYSGIINCWWRHLSRAIGTT
jgi:hypothetical protein